MNLLWPIALLGLLTLPVILLLHLLRSQRERIAIPSLLLWQGLQQEREGGAPRKIPLTLLLLLQLLIATALTLGIAQPALSYVLSRPQQTIFVLDTTTSMTATDVSPSRFEAARQEIRAAVQALGNGDTVAIVELGPQPEILLTGQGEQKATLLAALDNLVPGATGADLPEALSLASSLVDPNADSRIIVLTDGNLNVDESPLPPITAPFDWRFIPADASAGPANQAILNASAAELPDGRQRIFARVVNFSDAPASRTVRLLANGQLFRESVVDLEPEADADLFWTVPDRAETITIELTEPDALPLDNQADLLLLDTARQKVLLVSDQPETLAKSLEVQPGIEVMTLAPEMFNQAAPAEADLLVLDGLPSQLTAWPAGNVWVINPPADHPLLPGGDVIVNLRPDVETATPVLTGADLSGVYFGRVTRLPLPDWAEIDLLAAGDSIQSLPALIFHGAVNNSRIVVWAFDLEASNLPARLALPLLTANTLTSLLAPTPPATIAIGEAVFLPEGFGVETPTGQRLTNQLGADSRFERTKQPGLYRIIDSTGTAVSGFAVQAGTPAESNLRQRANPADIEAAVTIASASQAAPEIQYQQLWPWLAGLALAVVTAEGWLAWRR